MGKWKINHTWIYPIITVGLVTIIGFALSGQWVANKLKADSVSLYTITAILGDDQPASISQKSDQRIAQFELTTDSINPIEINALQFDALGDLKNKIVRQLNLAPLSVVVQEKNLGTGDLWVYDYGRITQTVHLADKSLMIVKDNPVTLDIYSNFSRQSGRTFGVSLIGIDSPLMVEGIPLDGYLRKIKVF